MKYMESIIKVNLHFIIIRNTNLGHGLSEGDRAYVENWDDFVDDFFSYVNQILSTKTDNIPNFLIGYFSIQKSN